MKIRLDATVEIDADAWEHIHGGEHPLTPATATAYLAEMFAADRQVTGVINVTAFEAAEQV